MNVGKGFVERMGWETVVGQREETVKEAMVIRKQYKYTYICSIYIYMFIHMLTHTHINILRKTNKLLKQVGKVTGAASSPPQGWCLHNHKVAGEKPAQCL